MEFFSQMGQGTIICAGIFNHLNFFSFTLLLVMGFSGNERRKERANFREGILKSYFHIDGSI